MITQTATGSTVQGASQNYTRLQMLKVCDHDYPECYRLHSTGGISEQYQVADVKGILSVTV